MGLKARNRVLRPGYELRRGWTEKEEEKEKFPLCVKA